VSAASSPDVHASCPEVSTPSVPVWHGRETCSNPHPRSQSVICGLAYSRHAARVGWRWIAFGLEDTWPQEPNRDDCSAPISWRGWMIACSGMLASVAQRSGARCGTGGSSRPRKRRAIHDSNEALMTIQFSQQGMAALPLNARRGPSSFVRRLVNARNDPAKTRIRAWLLALDDQRLAGFGLTPEDIALLRGPRCCAE
jgi:hypothetical protein